VVVSYQNAIVYIMVMQMPFTVIQVEALIFIRLKLVCETEMTTTMLTSKNELKHRKDLLRSQETSIAEVRECSYCWRVSTNYLHYY